ncbi:MAG: phosphate/phosphite/phosphonate ABC transporter substrate-binding protein [Paracoccaceae bacterium]
MIASLAMYDRAETAAANDALWDRIRQNLGFGPEALDRTTAFWDIWQSPELLLSQTCGMPYRTKLHGHVKLVGTPDYGLPDVAPGYYYSVLLVRVGDATDVADYQDRTLAYNGPTSQSGWAAPQNHARELGFCFTQHLRSGGHLASAVAVANGNADIAALDAVTWLMICQYEDIAKRLTVIGRTACTPGLPLITSNSQDAGVILAAIRSAIGEIGPEHRKTLHLKAIVSIPAASYLDVPTPAAP